MLKNSPRRQRGGMLSMLLTLVVIGLLAYFALRSFTASKPPAGAAGSDGELASCAKLAGDLVQRTGGLGPDYRKGYEALPAQCRGFLPPAAAQEGRADPDQGQQPSP